MAITAQQRAEQIAKFAQSTNDTASPEVQVSLLTQRIVDLTTHFKVNPKDGHSRMGLLKLVNQRRSMLAYLKRSSLPRYQKLIAELGLRR